MEEIINDLVLGELRYHKNNFWVRPMDAPVLNSNGNLKLVVQDDDKEGILDVQRKAYKTYLQNEETYKGIVTDYLLEYYKWNYEYIAREVNGVDENDHKDVVTEKQLYQFMTLWYLFICRDGSFGYAFGCCWDVDNGLAVILSESEPRVISRTQLKNLHKLNDRVLGLLVHDGKNAWKGLEVNSFFGKQENLEIELEGGVDEKITAVQQKAYEKYLNNKDDYFREFTKMMITVYTGDEEKASDMVMVARGDLGVECPVVTVPLLQKRIEAKCRLYGKPVIVATQMLESMISAPIPTRAEVSDVANAVYDGSDVVMLSGETAVGNYPVETVKTMRGVIETVETDPKYYEYVNRFVEYVKCNCESRAITHAANDVAKTMSNVNAIVTFSVSGATTLSMAQERPRLPIIAINPSDEIACRLNLVWGVRTYIDKKVFGSFDNIEQVSRKCALDSGIVNSDDYVIVTAGYPFGRVGLTNVLHIVKV